MQIDVDLIYIFCDKNLSCINTKLNYVNDWRNGVRTLNDGEENG